VIAADTCRRSCCTLRAVKECTAGARRGTEFSRRTERRTIVCACRPRVQVLCQVILSSFPFIRPAHAHSVVRRTERRTTNESSNPIPPSALGSILSEAFDRGSPERIRARLADSRDLAGSSILTDRPSAVGLPYLMVDSP